MPVERSRFSFLAWLTVVAALVGGCGSGTVSPSPTGSIPPNATLSIASPVVATPAASATPSPSATPTPSPTPTPSASPLVPSFDHVYVIILENKEYNQIVGSSAAPYENSLIAKYGVATSFYAERHPSEPNYIALTSGGTQGTTTDGTYNLDVPNLFDQITASGRTWHVYAQGYPGNCFKGSTTPYVVDGPGAAGDYARKHNPAISYKSVSGNPQACANITGLAGFDPAAANFEMIIPNEINDMHSSSVAAGDAFLKAFVPEIVDSPAFANSVLFITFDEGAGSDVQGGGGHIATLIASPGMAPGTKFTTTANHYSMLKTIETAWGLPFLGQAATASTIEIAY